MSDDGRHGVDASEWTPSRDDDAGKTGGTRSSTRPISETDADQPDDDNTAVPAELERPAESWRGDGDPTGSRAWLWLTRATLFSGLCLAFWSVPLALYSVSEGGPTAVVDGSALVVGALFLLAVLNRLVVLPVLLYLDAGKLRAAEAVEWNPERSFYMVTGALFATLACCYYLFKRQRHVGNPAALNNDELVYFEGRTVRSNWHRVVVLTPALTAIGGIGSLLEAVEGIHPDLSVALLGPVALLLVLALLLRLVFLPVAFSKDAAAVNRTDVDWEPDGTLYAVVGFVFALPTVLVYLYRRHRHTDGLF